jgi:catechol 2,3-dioxygenase-like lactoylglutathione lyase family enzyme
VARRRPGLVAMRRIAAGAFLFVGLFVFCFGLGNGKQSVMVAGVAVIVLAFIGRIATSFRRAPRQWIRGTGIVISATEPPLESRYGRCEMELVVNVPGMASETVPVHESRVPVAQWPKPRQELPIQVAADDPRNVHVLWRDYLSDELAAEVADEPEGPGEAFWEDDQPTPVPAEPPRSHLDQPGTAVVDFDLDAPPADPLAPTPAAASTADEGEVDHGTPPLTGAVVPPPRKKPSPHPHRPSSRSGAPATATATATAAAAAPPTTAATLDPVISDLVTTYPSAHPGPAGAINGVGVTVLVSDLARSVAFYRDKLGFYEVDGGEGNLVLASGETRLVLRQATDLGTVNRRLVHLNLEVADIDAMYAELKANGIRFTYRPKPVNQSARLELWAAAFQDPDGHGIAITQWRPAR